MIDTLGNGCKTEITGIGKVVLDNGFGGIQITIAKVGKDIGHSPAGIIPIVATDAIVSVEGYFLGICTFTGIEIAIKISHHNGGCLLDRLQHRVLIKCLFDTVQCNHGRKGIYLIGMQFGVIYEKTLLTTFGMNVQCLLLFPKVNARNFQNCLCYTGEVEHIPFHMLLDGIPMSDTNKMEGLGTALFH